MRGRRSTTGLVAVAVAAVLLLNAPTPDATPTAPVRTTARWDLAAIGAPAAWARGASGRGQVIAIVDSGIDLDHPDLAGRILAGATCLGTGGDAARCRTGGLDVEGHGTHVAGIAAATAPDARLLAVRALSASCRGCPPRGTAADVVAGIRWAAGRGADVINLSIDTVDGSLAGREVVAAFADAWAAGAVVVVAAGNRVADGAVAQPSLVVTGTDRTGGLAAYAHGTAASTWGLAAPGGAEDPDPDCTDTARSGISSTWVGGRHRCLSGTSMAAPHVAGAVADLRSLGYAPAGAVDRLIGSARAIRSDGAAGVGALDLATASSRRPVVEPVVRWPVASAGSAASTDRSGLAALPPLMGGGVMGLCAAVALLVLRDLRRAQRRAARQSLASASS